MKFQVNVLRESRDSKELGSYDIALGEEITFVSDGVPVKGWFYAPFVSLFWFWVGIVSYFLSSKTLLIVKSLHGTRRDITSSSLNCPWWSYR